MCPKIRFSTWDYAQGGTDWPIKYPGCGISSQSPINLLQPQSSYGKAYKFLKSKKDGFVANYYQLIGVAVDKQIKNNRIKITVKGENKNEGESHLSNGFVSNIGKQAFGAPTSWKSTEVSFKHKSEHTVESKRFDLEVQIFHNVDHSQKSGAGKVEEEQRLLSEDESENASG